MTQLNSQRIIDDYLARLDRELRDWAVPSRSELLAQVQSHIADARANLPLETHADLLNILEQLGPPEILAEAAREANRLEFHGPPKPQSLNSGTLTALSLVAVWPIGVVGILRQRALSSIERVALVTFAAIGPALALPYQSNHGLTLYTRVLGVLWGPATVTCLLAGLLIIWRPMFNRNNRAVTRVTEIGVRLAASLMIGGAWLILNEVERLLPF